MPSAEVARLMRVFKFLIRVKGLETVVVKFCTLHRCVLHYGECQAGGSNRRGSGGPKNEPDPTIQSLVHPEEPGS
ncbi:uncharacterized [Lates japonicus]